MFMFESWKILISVESFLRHFYFSSFGEVWKKKRITIYVTVYSLNEFRHVFFLMKCFFSSFFLFSSFGFKSVFLWNVLERKKFIFTLPAIGENRLPQTRSFFRPELKKTEIFFSSYFKENCKENHHLAVCKQFCKFIHFRMKLNVRQSFN